MIPFCPSTYGRLQSVSIAFGSGDYESSYLINDPWADGERRSLSLILLLRRMNSINATMIIRPEMPPSTPPMIAAVFVFAVPSTSGPCVLGDPLWLTDVPAGIPFVMGVGRGAALSVELEAVTSESLVDD